MLQHKGLFRMQIVTSLYLTLIVEEALCFLSFCGRDEGSHKHVDNGRQQDNEQNNLGLLVKSKDSFKLAFIWLVDHASHPPVLFLLPWLPMPYRLMICPGATPL